MKFIFKILKMLNLLKTPEQIHNNKLEYIIEHLSDVKENLLDILPIELRDRFKSNSYISGGCIYSLYHKTQPKDYDFFIKSKALAEDLREYFVDVSGYHGDNIHGGVYKNLPLTVTDNAISLGKYQIITRWVGKPEEVVEQFDFEHLMCYFINGELLSLVGFDSLRTNEIKYNDKRARDIVGSVMRANKFVARGMYIRQKEMAKMLLKLHEVGFDKRELEILNSAQADRHFSS